MKKIKGLVKSGKGEMLRVGDAAPGFSLVAHNRTRVVLEDLRGKKVLLWFYPVADTPG